MENKIEKYLEEKDIWKYFINEEKMDLENSTLESITVDIVNEDKRTVQVSISILYNLLEDSRQCDSSGKVIVDKKGNIKSIERVGSKERVTLL